MRITAGEHAAIAVLQPVLAQLLPDHPDLSIEIIVDYGLTDIVAEGYDAGVRLGEQVAKDMIAMRIGPDMRMAVVGSPAYFSRYPKPVIPADLVAHNCITLRMPTHGGLFMWEFEKNGQALKVRIEGQLVFNNIAMRLESALQGLGLAYMPEDAVRPHIEQGHLIRVLEDWCEPYSGYHLYYPSRRQGTDRGQLATLPVQIVPGKNIAEQMRLQVLVDHRGKIKQRALHRRPGNPRLIGLAQGQQLFTRRDRSFGFTPRGVFNAPLTAGIEHLHQLTEGIEASREARVSIQLHQDFLGLADRQTGIEALVQGAIERGHIAAGHGGGDQRDGPLAWRQPLPGHPADGPGAVAWLGSGT